MLVFKYPQKSHTFSSKKKKGKIKQFFCSLRCKNNQKMASLRAEQEQRRSPNWLC